METVTEQGALEPAGMVAAEPVFELDLDVWGDVL